jgi:hypothetical protein
MRMSASRLEQFAACPFKHYASYCLELSDRAPSEFTPALLGSLYHRLFDLAVERLAVTGYDWLAGDPAPLRTTLREVLADLRDEFAELANRRRSAYILERAELLCDRTRPRCQRVPQRASGCHATPSCASAPNQVQSCPRCGSKPVAWTCCSVVTSTASTRPAGRDGRRLRATSRRVGWDMFFAGQQLQLPVYMLALAGSGTPLAGSAEFQPIEPDWQGGKRAFTSASGMPEPGKSHLRRTLTQPDSSPSCLKRGASWRSWRAPAGRRDPAHPLRQGTGSWVACSNCSFRPYAVSTRRPAHATVTRPPAPPTELARPVAGGRGLLGQRGRRQQ